MLLDLISADGIFVEDSPGISGAGSCSLFLISCAGGGASHAASSALRRDNDDADRR